MVFCGNRIITVLKIIQVVTLGAYDKVAKNIMMY